MNFKLAVLPFYYPMNNTMTEKLKTSYATTSNNNLMYHIDVTKDSFGEQPSRSKMKYTKRHDVHVIRVLLSAYVQCALF